MTQKELLRDSSTRNALDHRSVFLRSLCVTRERATIWVRGLPGHSFTERCSLWRGWGLSLQPCAPPRQVRLVVAVVLLGDCRGGRGGHFRPANPRGHALEDSMHVVLPVRIDDGDQHGLPTLELIGHGLDLRRVEPINMGTAQGAGHASNRRTQRGRGQDRRREDEPDNAAGQRADAGALTSTLARGLRDFELALGVLGDGDGVLHVEEPLLLRLLKCLDRQIGPVRRVERRGEHLLVVVERGSYSRLLPRHRLSLLLPISFLWTLNGLDAKSRASSGQRAWS